MAYHRLIYFCCITLIFTSCYSAARYNDISGFTNRTAAIPAGVIDDSGIAGDLHEALGRSSKIIFVELEKDASLAVISVNAPDFSDGEYAMEELTFLLVNEHKFRVVDRHNLDIIRAEQQFQLSGEVDDATAVSIGNLIGAAFVITGSIGSRESLNYLRVRVLDVKTGEIKLMSSITYGGIR
ncbi:MAG: penicillin-binding protein activator LpoB [Treponema sp.]|nr:penicillin-binding protein activator LpoB [Treponema sp.]